MHMVLSIHQIIVDHVCLLMHLSKICVLKRDVVIQETGRSHLDLENSGAEVCIVLGDLMRIRSNQMLLKRKTRVVERW